MRKISERMLRIIWKNLYFVLLFPAASTLLGFSDSVIRVCPTSQYLSVNGTCTNCTVCKDIGKEVVLRPCADYLDTLCGSIADLDIDWSWLPKNKPKFKPKIVDSKNESSNAVDDISLKSDAEKPVMSTEALLPEVVREVNVTQEKEQNEMELQDGIRTRYESDIPSSKLSVDKITDRENKSEILKKPSASQNNRVVKSKLKKLKYEKDSGMVAEESDASEKDRYLESTFGKQQNYKNNGKHIKKDLSTLNKIWNDSSIIDKDEDHKINLPEGSLVFSTIPAGPNKTVNTYGLREVDKTVNKSKGNVVKFNFIPLSRQQAFNFVDAVSTSIMANSTLKKYNIYNADQFLHRGSNVTVNVGSDKRDKVNITTTNTNNNNSNDNNTIIADGNESTLSKDYDYDNNTEYSDDEDDDDEDDDDNDDNVDDDGEEEEGDDDENNESADDEKQVENNDEKDDNSDNDYIDHKSDDDDLDSIYGPKNKTEDYEPKNSLDYDDSSKNALSDEYKKQDINDNVVQTFMEKSNDVVHDDYSEFVDKSDFENYDHVLNKPTGSEERDILPDLIIREFITHGTKFNANEFLFLCVFVGMVLSFALFFVLTYYMCKLCVWSGKYDPYIDTEEYIDQLRLVNPSLYGIQRVRLGKNTFSPLRVYRPKAAKSQTQYTRVEQ